MPFSTDRENTAFQIHLFIMALENMSFGCPEFTGERGCPQAMNTNQRICLAHLHLHNPDGRIHGLDDGLLQFVFWSAEAFGVLDNAVLPIEI